jgi:hypothetical protein
MCKNDEIGMSTTQTPAPVHKNYHGPTFHLNYFPKFKGVIGWFQGRGKLKKTMSERNHKTASIQPFWQFRHMGSTHINVISHANACTWTH